MPRTAPRNAASAGPSRSVFHRQWVSLVPEAMRQVGLPGVVFVPLAGDVPVYDTHCLWKTEREAPALAAFLGAVRGIAPALESQL